MSIHPHEATRPSDDDLVTMRRANYLALKELACARLRSAVFLPMNPDQPAPLVESLNLQDPYPENHRSIPPRWSARHPDTKAQKLCGTKTIRGTSPSHH
ncbi:hypothetical protein JKG47_04300 [Acidithiobacillus sp. MC6.1]|nr:hypothetical protein [Acidithiobacillus sp. MC6.1]